MIGEQMLYQSARSLTGGIFITFSGNCRQALTFYQTCFGGELQFEAFDEELPGYIGKPVISGSLISDLIVIHGSDLVHNEGRKIGNYLSIFLPCKNPNEREQLISKLKSRPYTPNSLVYRDEELVEVNDIFAVRWVLGVAGDPS